MPEPSAFEFELAMEKLKGPHHQVLIPTELIKAVGRTIHKEIHKLTISIWNKE